MFIVGGILIIFGPPIGWNWAGFLLIELSVVTILGMCFVATYWVMRKTYSVGLDSVNGTPDIPLPAGSPLLSIALSDRKATTEFIKHLVNEVSVENIFFLSDIMAYKKSFVRINKLRSLGNGFTCQVGTQLARLIYRRTFTHYAWAISKTYIDGSSSLYVTAISDENRADVTEKLEDQDPQRENSEDGTKLVQLLEELQNVFDDCAFDVYEELKKSYARFAYTEQFGRVNIRRDVPPLGITGQTKR